MIKIGITGSLASGKTTASKILSINEDLFLVQIKL
jgi:dephospho-CoA kinase